MTGYSQPEEVQEKSRKLAFSKLYLIVIYLWFQSCELKINALWLLPVLKFNMIKVSHDILTPM